MKLHEVGEERLIAQLVAPLKARSDVIAGPGDDCAIVVSPGANQLLLLKTDCVVERVHFRPNEKPAAVGWKAMMRTLSDFAAMAGLPRYALVTLIAPPEREAQWVKQLYHGLERAAARFAVAIVGGETSATPGPFVLSISAVGTVEKMRCVRRGGGKPGDILFVTGRLGGSGKAWHLKFVARIEEARWLTENFRIHAMMDLSDGLGADLPRLAKASGAGFQIEERALPRHRGCSIRQALSDGEDYELLLAVSPNDANQLAQKWSRKFPRLLLTPIGRLLPLSRGRNQPLPHGYLHFQ